MKSWVYFVLMAFAYFIMLGVGFLIALYSNYPILVIGAAAVGCTLANYFDYKKKNK